MASLNGLQSGIDLKFSYTDINGIQQFQLLESITFSSDAPILTQIAIDGTVRNPQVYQGWNGTLVFQRNNSNLDDYINSQEANYNLGGDQIMGTITVTITNPDATIRRYQFENVAVQLTDGGNYTGTDIVKQTLTWKASRRLTIR